MQSERAASPSSPLLRQAALALGFAALVTVAGLTYVKWWPYYNKILKALDTHSMGGSILGPGGVVTSTGLATAWAYTVKYFKAVYQAVILGIVLGGAVEALLPTAWVRRFLSGGGFRPTLLAGVSSLPGMMCSCCAAPLAVGLRRRNASVGASLAFWMGNPALNPVTITLLVVILGWKFAAVRILLGVLVVFGLSYWLDRRFRDENRPPEAAPPAAVEAVPGPREHWALRWLKASGRLALWLVPEYLILVVAMGLLSGLLFPAGIGGWAHGPLALVLIAVAGTLFVIPTAAEIPIVQGLMAVGLPAAPAMALLVTLPTVSLPSLVMLGRSFKLKTLVALTLGVIIAGVLGGAVAALL